MDVWAEKESLLQKSSSCAIDFKDLWINVRRKLADLMKGIWFRRNQFCFENRFTSPRLVVGSALESMKTYKKAQDLKDEQKLLGRARISSHYWRPPATNIVKVNFDAAVDKNYQKIGNGVVMRDWEGELLHKDWLYGKLWRHYGVGCRKVVLEGDALMVIKAVQSEEQCLAWYGQLVEGLQQVVTAYPDWSLSFNPREGNYVAHQLAKLALLLQEAERIWVEDCPESIFSFVLKDKCCILPD
ncbi:hypothetical protein F2P56_010573 [Juglans regia]|uniref:RNase H type-1 domain-containing protein n=2 Tax=Juglans regia TaxID=51240 RepID=A0A834CWR8_JUGRE|nr:uncharacterized protein LOC108987572 [Juglans regia]KAF5470020.1 hypothetical protein F2P56_010573 [Juglans regia]